MPNSTGVGLINMLNLNKLAPFMRFNSIGIDLLNRFNRLLLTNHDQIYMYRRTISLDNRVTYISKSNTSLRIQKYGQ